MNTTDGKGSSNIHTWCTCITTTVIQISLKLFFPIHTLAPKLNEVNNLGVQVDGCDIPFRWERIPVEALQAREGEQVKYHRL